MSTTATKVTTTTVLKGGQPSEYLPIKSAEFNKVVDDLEYLDTRVAVTRATSAAINSSATATAAQVATGYITSTSGAATTITLPTGTLLGAYIGATAGTVLDLYIDNTAGSNTVTIAVATDGILSTAAADTAGSFGDLTVASGATGIGRYTLMFSSATHYVFTRTA